MSAYEGRLIAITGASRGIGRAAALALAAQGAHVIAIARSQQALEDLDDEVQKAGHNALTLVPLDLKDGDGLDRLGHALYERFKKLDGVFANAGVLGPLSPLQAIRPHDWDQTLAVNLTANFRLIRSFDPLLRQSDAGRFVFVTSGAAPRPKAYWGLYGASKAGLEAMVFAYAAEAQSSSIRANLFNPGPTRTAMRKKAFPGEDPEALPTPEAVAEQAIRLLSPDYDQNGVRVDYVRAQTGVA